MRSVGSTLGTDAMPCVAEFRPDFRRHLFGPTLLPLSELMWYRTMLVRQPAEAESGRKWIPRAMFMRQRSFQRSSAAASGLGRAVV